MTFDHRDAGTQEKVWQECLDLAALPSLELPDAATEIVVLAAHPDDETLGAGGLIALAEQRNLRIKIIIASDGEGSHPDSTTHTPTQLATIRRGEAISAMRSLAPHAAVIFLALPDGDLKSHQDAITQVLRKMVTGQAWIFTPWHKDGHPDHEACAFAAQALANETPNVRLLEYPIWPWHWARPEDMGWEQSLRTDLPGDIQRLKKQALEAYVSQTNPLSQLPGDEPVLSAEMLAHFLRSYETFIETNPKASSEYFEQFYAAHDDPWGLAECFYEKRKRDLLVSSLPRERFRRAFEPGCATGLLTQMLAPRCDQLLATDIVQQAVTSAQRRLAQFANVDVALAQIPSEWPAGSFDLIVISEVGYYCCDLDALALRVRNSLSDDGTLVACHWRHPARAHVHTAEAVHASLSCRLHRLAIHAEEDFLLEVWCVQDSSVARREGIVA